MSRFLVMCLQFLVVLWPYLLLPPLIAYFWWRNRRWAPKTTGRSLSVRNFEAALCGVVLLLIGVVWLHNGTPRLAVPDRFHENISETLRGNNLQTARWATAVAFVAVPIAWRFSTTLAVTLIMISGISGVIAVQQKVFHHQNEYRDIPFEQHQNSFTDVSDSERLRIELINDIAGADLWINGVLLGKTPFETTCTELMAKVPQWDHVNIQPLQYPQTEANAYITPQGYSRSSWGEISLHFPVSNANTKKLYYKVEIDGTPGFSYQTLQKSESNGETSGSINVITLDTVFPVWETEIEVLLDRARLDNYHVDEAWLTAFDSYGAFANRQLETAMPFEPSLLKIRDARIRFTRRLDDTGNAASAWAHLMRIQEEARSSRCFDSGSESGIAVDLLVPMLDPKQLVDHAIRLLNTASKIDPGSRSISIGRFATMQKDDEVVGDEIALWPIAHAVWRLDQLLDAEANERESASTSMQISLQPLPTAIHPDLDNIVERRITPEIIKLSYGSEQRLDFAAILGGSAYESFLLRNDWDRPAGYYTNYDRNAGQAGYIVNRWFYKLLWLRSPLGQAFRSQHSREILRIYNNPVSDRSLDSDKTPDELQFLFIDRNFANSRPSLAMEFWPNINARLTKSRMRHMIHQPPAVLSFKWDYLARLWPESTPEMFLSAYREFQESASRPEFIFFPGLPAVLNTEAQYQIMKTILAAEEKRIETLPGDPQRYGEPKYFGSQMLSELRSRLFWLPCESASRHLVDELNADPLHNSWSQLRALLSNNRHNEDLLRMLVESGNPRMQLITLPAIERHPIPGRVEMLERLLAAESIEVRDAATVVMQRLEELRHRQFPHRASVELEQTPTGPQ